MLYVIHHHRLALLILCFAFLYRLLYFDYPLINTESHRDYVIAQHILGSHDFPQTGPCCIFNGGTSIFGLGLSALLFIPWFW